jgi:hypothetical protein
MTADDIPPLTENEERVLNAISEMFNQSRQLLRDESMEQLGITDEEIAKRLGMTEDEVREATETLIRHGMVSQRALPVEDDMHPREDLGAFYLDQADQLLDQLVADVRKRQAGGNPPTSDELADELLDTFWAIASDYAATSDDPDPSRWGPLFMTMTIAAAVQRLAQRPHQHSSKPKRQ